jgi:ParB-like chromosome segregation protein Spo0J
MLRLKEIPAIVREMDDKQLRLYSIVENLHRLDLTSIEREEAIYQLWKKHYEPDGKSMAQMSKELGKAESYVSHNISFFERRNRLDLPSRQISSRDLDNVSGLDDATAKDLLSAKSEGKLETRDLQKLAPILREAPEEKRQEIVEELLESKGHIEEYEAGVVEMDDRRNSKRKCPRAEKGDDCDQHLRLCGSWMEITISIRIYEIVLT